MQPLEFYGSGKEFYGSQVLNKMLLLPAVVGVWVEREVCGRKGVGVGKDKVGLV